MRNGSIDTTAMWFFTADEAADYGVSVNDVRAGRTSTSFRTTWLLSPSTRAALASVITWMGFDASMPISVEELRDPEGFILMQPARDAALEAESVGT